jgi:hypothetical protein
VVPLEILPEGSGDLKNLRHHWFTMKTPPRVKSPSPSIGVNDPIRLKVRQNVTVTGGKD